MSSEHVATHLCLIEVLLPLFIQTLLDDSRFSHQHLFTIRGSPLAFQQTGPDGMFHATFGQSREDTYIRGDGNERPLEHILSWAGKWVLPGLCLPLFLPPPMADHGKESRNL